MTEEKHTREELKQWQSLPLEVKVMMTMDRIRSWYEYWDGQIYVSFSGGKDSSVLKHIVESIYPDVPSVFADTGLEYPEIRKFALSQPNVVAVKPKLTFKEVVEKSGYPVISKECAKHIYSARIGNGRSLMMLHGSGKFDGSRYSLKKWEFLLEAPFDISDKCCYYMKKSPLYKWEGESKRASMVATMTEESLLRETAWIKFGCNIFDSKHPKSKPMSFWTEQDVLRYIDENDVPYCKEIYGDIRVKLKDQVEGQMNIYDIGDMSTEGELLETTGAKRTGCVFCMFGCHLDKEPNRFQRLKKTHPRLYQYCINGGQWKDGKWMPSNDGLGLGYVLDTIGVKY